MGEPVPSRFRGLLGRLLALYFFATFAQELPTTAIGLILVQQLDLSPAQVALYYGMMYVPWCFKPAMAFLSDHFPIRGRRRQPYFAILAGLASVFCILCALSYDDTALFVTFSMLWSLCGAYLEVILNSVAVEFGCGFRKLRSSRTQPSDSLTKFTMMLVAMPGDRGDSFISFIQSEASVVRSTASLAAAALAIVLHATLSLGAILGGVGGLLAVLVVLTPLLPERMLWESANATVVEEQEVTDEEMPDDEVDVPPKPSLCARFRSCWRIAQHFGKSLFLIFALSAMPTTQDIYMTYVYSRFDTYPTEEQQRNLPVDQADNTYIWPTWAFAGLSFMSLLGALVGAVVFQYFFVYKQSQHGVSEELGAVETPADIEEDVKDEDVKEDRQIIENEESEERALVNEQAGNNLESPKRSYVYKLLAWLTVVQSVIVCVQIAIPLYFNSRDKLPAGDGSGFSSSDGDDDVEPTIFPNPVFGYLAICGISLAVQLAKRCAFIPTSIIAAGVLNAFKSHDRYDDNTHVVLMSSEGFAFSLFSSLQHLGSFLSSLISAAMAHLLDIHRHHWSPIVWFIVICAVLQTVPLLLSCMKEDAPRRTLLKEEERDLH